jgi:hypothetical protein
MFVPVNPTTTLLELQLQASSARNSTILDFAQVDSRNWVYQMPYFSSTFSAEW